MGLTDSKAQTYAGFTADASHFCGRNSGESLQTPLQKNKQATKGENSSIMLLEKHLNSNHSSGFSSGFIWEIYNALPDCNAQNEGIYFWEFCSFLFFAFGFPASITVIWELFKTHRNGMAFTPNDFFILNLSVMDAVFMFFIPPGILNRLFWHKWQIDVIWNGIYALNLCGRPLLMACVCLDCYVAVVHPITYHKRKSLTPRVLLAAVVWMFTVSTGVVYFLLPMAFPTMLPTLPFIIAIVTIGICDFFILHTLMKAHPGGNTIHPQKQRGIHTVINSLIVVVISYVPPVLLITIGLRLISDATTLYCMIAIPSLVTSTMGSAVMPMLYLNNLGKFDHFMLGGCRKS
ncbi:adrenocorticotropic hormone receptor-like [Thalassophryne amazonica]|uniref:adrenocorticotropic hormone receptor-like n=1 Tax=Thalassophryne amazonica TaxID=390379 RepID=UPI0014708F68|nr:adrenocorticotropic hormone receptor-like [Thalassophryne amazonica]